MNAAADPRYPIGRFDRPLDLVLTPAERAHAIEELSALPAQMRRTAEALTPAQLDTPYRDGGWTARQVVHHVPDSHMNGYIRCKLAVTEDVPTVKPYDEAAWAELGDVRSTPIAVSLSLVEGVHGRWVALLRSFSPSEFERTMRHPEHGTITVDWVVALYAWHGRHHTAQIASVSQR